MRIWRARESHHLHTHTHAAQGTPIYAPTSYAIASCTTSLADAQHSVWCTRDRNTRSCMGCTFLPSADLRDERSSHFSGQEPQRLHTMGSTAHVRAGCAMVACPSWRGQRCMRLGVMLVAPRIGDPKAKSEGWQQTRTKLKVVKSYKFVVSSV